MAKGTGTSRANRLGTAPPKAAKAIEKSSHPQTKPLEDQLKVVEKQLEKKAEPKKPFRKGVTWLSECIQISDMYRVKGRPGIWLMFANPHKSGVVRMQQFLTVNYCTVPLSTLEPLGNLIIKRNAGEVC